MPGVRLVLRNGAIVTDQFDLYIKTGWPNGLPPEQATELKKAFFGGATVVLGILQIINQDPNISETSAMTMLEAVQKELVTYAQGLPPDNPSTPILRTPRSTH